MSTSRDLIKSRIEDEEEEEFTYRELFQNISLSEHRFRNKHAFDLFN